MEHSIDEVVATLRRSRDGKSKQGGVLLVGAGCSHSAGIPLAAEFVEEIRRDLPEFYRQALGSRSYADCMKALVPKVRQQLIARHVENARVNWAHICIASLLRAGYIDRILTTNFDNLIIRACALLDEFPAVYDLAVARTFKPSAIPTKAVFYLHGQYTGFLMKNTPDEVREQARELKPVFDEVGTERPWIVVGYSGLNDPVFELLTDVHEFDFGLEWVGYGDREPPDHVRTQLLEPEERYARYVRGYDADSFFVTLAQKLSVFPPEIVRTPFTYVKNLLGRVAPWTSPGHGMQQDILRLALDSIESAIRGHEAAVPGSHILALQMAGDWRGLLGAAERLDPDSRGDVADALAWAYTQLGDEWFAQAGGRPQDEGLAPLEEAARAYEEALRLSPNLSVAVNNLGNTLAEQAKRRSHDRQAALPMLGAAADLFRRATVLNPHDVHAMNNLGKVLMEMARISPPGEAEPLLVDACERFRHALRIQPGAAYVLNNWGEALFEHARLLPGPAADRLLEEAADKHRQAALVRPDDAYAYTHWADSLLARARLPGGERALALLAAAAEKYQKADEIQPGSGYVLNNWGKTLFEWGMLLQGIEADPLFEQAAEKHHRAHVAWPTDAYALEREAEALLQLGWRAAEPRKAEESFQGARLALEQALRLRPRVPQLLNNLGCALYELGRLKEGHEAEPLFVEAASRHREALEANPADVYALDNWAKVLLERARTYAGAQAEPLVDEAAARYRQALEMHPRDDYALCGWGDALVEKARLAPSGDAPALLDAAEERYHRALEIDPTSVRTLCGVGDLLLHRARLAPPDQADALLQDAANHYGRALETDPRNERARDSLLALETWCAACAVLPEGSTTVPPALSTQSPAS
jgi:Tfp pilus assembly protein PilF/NAD-dependent SIR2 family protein deacetylase